MREFTISYPNFEYVIFQGSPEMHEVYIGDDGLAAADCEVRDIAIIEVGSYLDKQGSD